jgi:hypothetical protein
MSYLNSLLATNERVVRVSRDHWIVLLPTIIADGVIGLAIVGLSVLGVVFSFLLRISCGAFGYGGANSTLSPIGASSRSLGWSISGYRTRCWRKSTIS